jgi:hypothetical protein
VLSLRCDARTVDVLCAVGGQSIEGDNPVVELPGADGAVRFAIEEVFPDSAPQRVVAVLRLVGGSELRDVAVGDKDDLLDERAAAVISVGNSTSRDGLTSLTVRLSMGVDASRDGQTYRGQPLQPGSQLTLTLPRATVRGVVQSVERSTPVPAQ